MPRVLFGVAVAVLVLVAAGCDNDETDAATTEAAKPVRPGCEEESAGQALQAGGSIAFAVARRAGSELVVLDVGTRKIRKLTEQRTRHDGVSSGAAIAWSPDGMSIAYSGGGSGWNGDTTYDDIWVIAADGGRPRHLTGSYESDWSPAWSPDARRVAFDRQDDGLNWIYVVNADGTRLRRLTGSFNWHPAWTPDGRISYVDSLGIMVVDADGANRQRLLRAPVDLSSSPVLTWSPDGRLLAFTTDVALWVVRSDGSGRRKIFADPARTTRTPVWSPDGRKIAWAQGDGDLEIYIANRDGSDVRNLTNNKGFEDDRPSWSANGRAIVFLRTCRIGPDREKYVVAMNIDGSGSERLSSGGSLPEWPAGPVWSP
jgi:TolB protein